MLSFAAVIWIIASRNHPDYKIAWIVPIMALPVFGGLLYLLFGGNRLSQRSRRRLGKLEELQRPRHGGWQSDH